MTTPTQTTATPEQIQAKLAAAKASETPEATKESEQPKVAEPAQDKVLVVFAAFRSDLRNCTIRTAGGSVDFFNHEAYVKVTPKNMRIIERLNQIVEEEPAMGVYFGRHGKTVEVDPVELDVQRRQAEMQLFLSERARRMAPVVSVPDRFVPSSSDASPLTKGENAGNLRFSNVDLNALKGK